MAEHRLIDDALIRDQRGITARCRCGWSSGGHFSSMGASAAMLDHQEQCERAERAGHAGEMAEAAFQPAGEQS